MTFLRLLPLLGALVIAGDRSHDSNARNGQATVTLRDLIESRGLPCFAASDLGIDVDTLIASELQDIDPGNVNQVNSLRGRALIYCEPRASLPLWVALIEFRMREATPSLGQEGPGRVFDPTPSRDAIELFSPVQLEILLVNADGNVTKTEKVRVSKLQVTRRTSAK